jgi:citrate lyase alpha subunit
VLSNWGNSIALGGFTNEFNDLTENVWLRALVDLHESESESEFSFGLVVNR